MLLANVPSLFHRLFLFLYRLAVSERHRGLEFHDPSDIEVHARNWRADCSSSGCLVLSAARTPECFCMNLFPVPRFSRINFASCRALLILSFAECVKLVSENYQTTFRFIWDMCTRCGKGMYSREVPLYYWSHPLVAYGFQPRLHLN